jgi:hypothetical protein
MRSSIARSSLSARSTSPGNRCWAHDTRIISASDFETPEVRLGAFKTAESFLCESFTVIADWRKGVHSWNMGSRRAKSGGQMLSQPINGLNASSNVRGAGFSPNNCRIFASPLFASALSNSRRMFRLMSNSINDRDRSCQAIRSFQDSDVTARRPSITGASQRSRRVPRYSNCPNRRRNGSKPPIRRR